MDVSNKSVLDKIEQGKKKMSKKVIIESTVRNGMDEDLMSFLTENLPAVRGFKGCRNVTVFFDSESRKMIFDEEWGSIEDHQRYIASIAENGVMNQLVTFLESPPEIKYLDRLDI
jgi:quinol monooxygenase YgiN